MNANLAGTVPGTVDSGSKLLAAIFAVQRVSSSALVLLPR